MSIAVNPGVMAPPAANTFQPGSQNDRVGTSEQKPKAEQTQPRQSASAEGRKAEDRARDSREDARVATEASASSSQQRGSVVDIEV